MEAVLDIANAEQDALIVKATEQLRFIADETGLPFEELSSEYAKVDIIEQAIMELPPINWEPVHRFSKGLYAREQSMPRGWVITGVAHRTEHFSVLSKGAMMVWTPFEGSKMVEAPYTFHAKPGTRRVAIVLEDLVWTCFHATTTTDLAALAKELYFDYDNPLLGPNGRELRRLQGKLSAGEQAWLG